MLSVPTAAGSNLTGEYLPLPAAPYFVQAQFEWHAASLANYVTLGLMLRSSTGAYINFGPQYDTSQGGGWCIDIGKWTNATTFSAHYSQTTLVRLGGIPCWYGISDDGTNRKYMYSFTGRDWVPLLTTARTDFITPTGIGWGGFNSSGDVATLRLHSWSGAY